MMFVDAESVVSLRVYSADLQRGVRGACAGRGRGRGGTAGGRGRGQGVCDHLCVPSGEQHSVCRCAAGYTLREDHTTCRGN